MQQNTETQQAIDNAPEPGWISRNGIPLLFVACIIALLVYYQAMLSSVGLVVIGLGLVIFIHELGHFVAAKLCDVHVEAFSIGFGPSLPGCEVKWGETTYKVGMIPLGGYVKMVGEGTDGDDGEEDPRSYKNKPVGQRMMIISAGVIMNMILAIAGFVGVYMTSGEERPAGIIGVVEAGSPAWQLGLRSGAVLLQVGSIKNPFFDDVKPEIVLSAEGQKVPITFEMPGSPPVQTAIEPKYDPDGAGMPLIGVGMASRPTLRGIPRKSDPPFIQGSAASLANPQSLQSGDQIVATTDPADPTKMKELPIDSRDPNHEQRDYFELYRRQVDLASQPITLKVANNRSGKTTETTVPPEYYRDLGIIMGMGQVVAVRDGSPAAKAGVRPRSSERGDVIKQVEVAKPGGGVIRFVSGHSTKPQPDVEERALDPMRLPFELQRWAKTATSPKIVKLSVMRPSGHAQNTSAEVNVDWDDGWDYSREVQLSTRAPLSIPGLGLAYRVETVIEDVVPNSVADKAGLKSSDVVKAIQFYRGPVKSPEPIKTGWLWPTPVWNELKSEEWAGAFSMLHEHFTPSKVNLRVQRGEKLLPDVVLEPPEEKTWPLVNRGMIFEIDSRQYIATSVGQALSMGANRTKDVTGQIYRSLKSIIVGRISFPKSASGPISIAASLYDVAGESFPKFILFLSILSVNLAVINFLPIPLLDGGHMVFLLYEKARGKPAPESVRVAATFAGMALIGSLMLYVIVLDVMKYVF